MLSVRARCCDFVIIYRWVCFMFCASLCSLCFACMCFILPGDIHTSHCGQNDLWVLIRE